MPRLLVDTDYKKHPQIIGEQDKGVEEPGIPGEIRVFWEEDWSKDAFLKYQNRYGLTNEKFTASAVVSGTYTDCSSIVAQSFQKPSRKELDQILSAFEVSDYNSTIKLIAKYPDLEHLLERTQHAIQRYFKKATVRLVPKTDPETGKEEIWLYVHTELSVMGALDILEKFDEEFFLNVWNKSNKLLCFDLIFK